jgi:type IV pilus assembly protein PilN
VIRTNLSTRPFYNERAVHFWLLVIAAAVVLATAFNVTRILRYSRSDTELAARAANDETRAADLRQQAARLRASVDPKQVEFASAEARQANELIDRRTFSWTELLNHLEMTQPDDVRLVAVRPRVDREGRIMLVINVVAKAVESVDTFMQNLEDTAAFANLRPVVETVDDEGLIETTLECDYVPSAAKPVENKPEERAPAESKPEEKDSTKPKPSDKDRRSREGAPRP